MFRVVLLSIVLTLAAEPNAALLCRAWCEPHEAATTGCHHEAPGTSPTVTGTDNCDSVTVGAIAFFGDDARRARSASRSPAAVTIPRFHFTAPPIDGRAGYATGPPLPLEARPLMIALRI